jgi:hypothetical protein
MDQPEIGVGATVVTNVVVRRALLDLDTVLHRLLLLFHWKTRDAPRDAEAHL